eukprot:1134558-Pelagomonas_calceolata.AAC.3
MGQKSDLGSSDFHHFLVSIIFFINKKGWQGTRIQKSKSLETTQYGAVSGWEWRVVENRVYAASGLAGHPQSLTIQPAVTPDEASRAYAQAGCPDSEPDVLVKRPAVTARQEPLPAHLGSQTCQAYLESRLNKSSYTGCGQTWCLPGFHVCTTFARQMH